MLIINKEYAGQDITISIRKSAYRMARIKLLEATQEEMKLIKKAGLPYVVEAKAKPKAKK